MNKEILLFVVNVDWFFESHRLPVALKALEEGYEVHLLCADTGKLTALAELGLVVHSIGFSRSGRNIIRELLCFFTLYRNIKKIKPDIVHLVSIKPVIYGGIVGRIVGVSGVVSAVSGLGFVFADRSSFGRRMLRAGIFSLYRIAAGHSNQRVIFQNSTDMQILVDAGVLRKDKARMIRGSGVDINEYRFLPEPPGVPVIVMASRLLVDKGVREFVEAAKLLKSRGYEVHFQLIGEPDFESPESIAPELIEQWRDEGVVECLGFRSDIAALFSMAHVVVCPSYAEGLPKVLIEAAACGRAVVTSDVPGCRAAIEPGRTGLLVPPRDVEALSKAIECLLVDQVLRQKMGASGRRLAEKEFRIEQVVDAHLAIYRELSSRSAA